MSVDVLAGLSARRGAEKPVAVFARLIVVGMAVGLLSCSDGGAALADEEISWIQAHAVRIADADPASSEPNLSALREMIGEARVVGLGEATHGTTEFWGIRQKISRYLVQEMGFTAILMEAGFPNSLFLHDYVARGEGTAAEAHEKLGTWRYQEMRTLIDWMREHNAQKAEQDPTLHFLGYDCAFYGWDRAKEVISEYLQAVNPAAVAEVVSRLDNYTTDDADWVLDHFVAQAEEYIAAGGDEEYQLTLRIVENLAPNWTVWYNLRNGLPDLGIRDEQNLANVAWIIEELLGGGKVIIWAHNGHVGNTILLDNGVEEAQMLGSRLRERYGDDYYVAATEFYLGQFLAWDRCDGHTLAFISHRAGVPDEDTYAYQLAKEGIPLYFLNLRGVDYSREETAWLQGPLEMRDIGASYCREYDREYFYRTVSLPEEYDGVIYLGYSNPATQITF